MSTASGAWPERGSCKVWGWQVFCSDFCWSSGHVPLVFLGLVLVRYLNLSLILSPYQRWDLYGDYFFSLMK
jgi:hypothetical protein